MIGGRFEGQIAPTAVSAFGDAKTLAKFVQIGHDRFLIFFEYLGSDRYLEYNVITIGPGTLPSGPTFAILREELR